MWAQGRLNPRPAPFQGAALPSELQAREPTFTWLASQCRAGRRRAPGGQPVQRLLVGIAGFEPATLRSRSGCATVLRHIPAMGSVLTGWFGPAALLPALNRHLSPSSQLPSSRLPGPSHRGRPPFTKRQRPGIALASRTNFSTPQPAGGICNGAKSGAGAFLPACFRQASGTALRGISPLSEAAVISGGVHPTSGWQDLNLRMTWSQTRWPAGLAYTPRTEAVAETAPARPRPPRARAKAETASAATRHRRPSTQKCPSCSLRESGCAPPAAAASQRTPPTRRRVLPESYGARACRLHHSPSIEGGRDSGCPLTLRLAPALHQAAWAWKSWTGNTLPGA
jgi:hypothetical protein